MNHHHLLISYYTSVSAGLWPFRVLGMWVSHPSFLDLVISVWSSSVPDSDIRGPSSEVEASEGSFEEMELEVFGDVALNVTKANEREMVI